MKILMLTPYLPYPPNSGGQIRTYNLLRNLSSDHSITLVSLYKNSAEKAHSETLNSLCSKVYLCKRPEKPWQISNILKAVFGPLPFLIVRNYSDEAAQTVANLLKNEKFDVIHAETFYVMPHIPKTNIPILLVEQTLEYRVYKHYINKLPWFLKHPLRLDTYKLKVWESYYWRRAQLVAAVSQADADAIHNLSPEINPIVIPNGASDEMFVHKEDPNAKSIPPKLLFVGNFSWLQNTEAAEYLLTKVAPIIFTKNADVCISIAGQNIPKDFDKYKSDRINFFDLNNAKNPTVHNLYKSASIFVAPIFGPGGTRLKILTAMASRTPVVTTPTGAEGLFLEQNKSVLMAENEQDFSQRILDLLNDPSKAETISNEAYQIAISKFSWSSISASLIKAYSQLVSSSSKSNL